MQCVLSVVPYLSSMYLGIMNITAGARWIVGNPYERYFYRVTYDDVMWAELSEQLLTNHSMIPAASRAQLIDDSFSLAR